MRGLAILIVVGTAGLVHAGTPAGGGPSAGPSAGSNSGSTAGSNAGSQTGSAAAETPIAKADKLFAEAQHLREQGHEAEACVKFGQALALNPSAVGTLLNVALCNEEGGKFASAVKLFAQARDLARERGLVPQREAAEQHLAKDEPQVAHVALAFAEPPGLTTTIVIDGAAVPVASAADVPVDPGDHRLTVTQPGRVAYEASFTVSRQQHVHLAVPALGYPVTVKNTRRTVGKILVISGGALTIAGVVIGGIASAHYNQPFDTAPDDVTIGHCERATKRCNDAGRAHVNNARHLGWIGTGVGIAGVVAAGAGAALWLLWPEERTAARPAVSVVPVLAPDRTGIAVLGHF